MYNFFSRTIRLFIVVILLLAGINFYVIYSAIGYTDVLPDDEASYGLILGASVKSDHTLSDALRDRVDCAISLKNSPNSSESVDSFFDKYLVSGDDSQVHYQEVHAIKKYLMIHGVEEDQIVGDPSGFDTYDSLRRAKNLYGADSLMICTQWFHLWRSVYIARGLGIEAYGISPQVDAWDRADVFHPREVLARIKAFLDVEILNSSPMHSEKTE